MLDDDDDDDDDGTRGVFSMSRSAMDVDDEGFLLG